jgi:hypothetical protein
MIRNGRPLLAGLLALLSSMALIWQVGTGSSSISRTAARHAAPPVALADLGSPVSLASLPQGMQTAIRTGSAASSDLRLRYQPAKGWPVYTFHNAEGQLCLARHGATDCPGVPGQTLLSNGPVYQAGEGRVTIAPDGAISYTETAWYGLVRDGITRMALIADDGTKYTTPVVSGLFDLEGISVHPNLVQALDSAGRVVWSFDDSESR